MPEEIQDQGEKKIARKFGEIPRGVQMRLGTVTAVSVGPPRLITATVGGVSIANIPILDSANGVVGTNVWIASMGGGQLLAIGHSNGVGLRLAAGGEASLASTDHAFQIGPSTGANLIMDTDEIQARNNGAAATLRLNPADGLVIVGAGTTNSQLQIGDDVRIQDVNVAHTLGLVSVSNTAIGNLRLGLNGPQINTDGSYIHLDAISDVYIDGNTKWFRDAAGGNHGYFNNAELGIYGNRAIYFADWGGGWFMQDSLWIRASGNKNVYTAGEIRAGNGFTFSNAGYVLRQETDTDTGLYWASDGHMQIRANGSVLMETANTIISLEPGSSSQLRLRTNSDANHYIGYRSTVAAAIHPSSGVGSDGPWISGYSTVVLGLVSSGWNTLWCNNWFVDISQGYQKFSSGLFKDDIQPIDPESALDEVLRWNPVTFKSLTGSDPEERHDGFIAEELHAVNPRLVCTVKEEYLNETKEQIRKRNLDPNQLSVGQPNAIDYGQLTVRLTAAIHALHQQIEELKEEVRRGRGHSNPS